MTESAPCFSESAPPPFAPDCRVLSLINAAVNRLTACDLPRLESYLLLSHAAGIPKERLLAMRDESLSPETANRFADLVERRRLGEPSAYLLKQKEFYGRALTVTPDVLIPRPDTEILVETALALMQCHGLTSVWDVCTGSGAVILSIAAERAAALPPFPRGAEPPGPGTPPAAERFFASDISAAALRVAADNLNAYRLPVTLFRGDLLSAMPDGLTVDLIVGNPPYLTDAQADGKQAEGWREPDAALRGGPDGLSLIRRIVRQAPEKLSDNGFLLLEAAPDQMDAVQTLLETAGFCRCRRVRDLARRERVCVGQKVPSGGAHP